MARGRWITPDFYEDEKIERLSDAAQLLFIRLWQLADDDGHVRGALSYIHANFRAMRPPEEKAALLAELVHERLVFEYEADGQRYIWIKNFKKHQQIKKPSKWRLPPHPASLGTSTPTSTPTGGATGSRPKGEREAGGGEREAGGGEREAEIDLGAAVASPPASGPQPEPDPEPTPDDDEPEDAEHGWRLPWQGPNAPRIVAPSKPNPTAMLVHWMLFRTQQVSGEEQDVAWDKTCGLLKRHVEKNSVNLVRKAWLCWLLDPWAASRAPPYSLGAFLAGDQFAKQKARAARVEWVPEKLTPDDWELPWLVNEAQEVA